MKVVIFAGGLGTRISEESHLRPKPMIEIGDRPILWHIMKIYSHYGFNEFVICLGYKGNLIKEFFADYYLYMSNVTFDFSNNDIIYHNNIAEPWKVTLVDTGLYTQTGGRLARVREYLGDEPFMLTYGDGVSDVNIQALKEFHESHGKIATITAVQPGGRFGVLDMDDDDTLVHSFQEKPPSEQGWINGGFMVLQPEIFDFLGGDDCILEQSAMQELCRREQLIAYRHTGFWKCMDTQRDKNLLEKDWASEAPPWKLWK